MNEDDRIAIDRVMPGMGLHALPDGWTPLEALVLIKCLDDEGEPAWCFRTTHRPNRQELLGALIEHTDLLRARLVREWENED
ncbi:MAG: hypothetical protein ACTHMZ_07060 [Actinomycetes bacterium]